MPGFFGRVQFFVVLGGVGCILGAASARAQDTAQTGNLNRSEAVLSTTVSSFAHQPSHVETFAAFVREIGADDLSARKESITGEKQPRVDWKTVNHALIGLTDEEWNSAYAILLGGSLRVAEWGDQMQDALGWKDGRFQADSSRIAAEQRARFDQLNDQGDAIVDQTMVRLRQELGDDAFNRLDTFVYHRESGERIINRGPIKRGQIQTANATPETGIQAGIPTQK
jgi:hypothetical protein